jgi:hypothetical protein
MMRRLALAGGIVVAAALWSAPAAAQATLGFDAAFNSQYVWRGLTFTNAFVIQPDVYLSFSGFTVGAWANVETKKGTGANDLSENGGARSGIAEIDLWAEYGRTTGNAAWKAGWILYTFNKKNAAFSNAFDTHEVYGQISLSGMPITPTLYASYDVDKVKGLYVQPSVVYGVRASPALTINLGVLAGISAGQEVNTGKPAEGANFAKSGLTHVDFSASTSFAAGPLSIVPALHFQINNDANTKVTGALAANRDKSSKVWGGITISWSRALGAAK